MNPFDFFDHIYLINIAEQTDRLAETVIEMDKLDITARTEVFYADVSILDPSISIDEDAVLKNIFYNKYLVVKDAKEKGYNNILILEDDIVFEPDASLNFTNSINAIDPDWDLFYLCSHFSKNCYHRVENGIVIESNFDPSFGLPSDEYYANNYGHYAKVDNGLFKVTGGTILLLPALGINNTFYDEFLDAYENNIGKFYPKDIDYWLSGFGSDPSVNVYTSVPLILHPRPGVSQRTGEWFDPNPMGNRIYTELLKM